jgi:hypothetical protein
MNKKSLTLGTVWAILIFSVNSSFWQEIANVLDQKKIMPQTEQTNKKLSDTLNYDIIDKQQFQEQKYKIIKKIWTKNTKLNNKYKKEFETLVDTYLIGIENQIIQDPQKRRQELELLYFECEFIDIQTPNKLKYVLSLTKSRVME